MNGAAYKALNGILELLYPPNIYCICCGKIIDSSRTYSMCNDCIGSIRWVGGRNCTKCGKGLNENNPKDICFDCSGQAHSFDRGFICSEYGVHEKTLLYELKYASEGYIGETLGEIAYDRMAAELGEETLAASYDMVIPVPIYKLREQRRGFNQAELIAKSFAKRAGLNLEREIIIRTKATAAMKGLDAAERRANISGAFEIRARKLPLIKGAKILLVDDIYTTGATLDEAASVLKAAGASKVDFIAFASGADILPA
ncbi:MAG: ComF family protein [Mogibacterium sp.]|nr:ComF family protein [Mogibacterium sp.]